MKQFTKLMLLTAAMALVLSACQITPPTDPELQKDLEESMEELDEDFETFGDVWDEIWDDSHEVEKDHYWKILDAEGNELYAITDEDSVNQIDDLLCGDQESKVRMTEDPGDPAYTYIYTQEETLKAGQDPEDRAYEDLLSFTVSASKNVVTMKIMEDLPDLAPYVDLDDYLTFVISVPSETAQALRDPSQFAD